MTTLSHALATLVILALLQYSCGKKKLTYQEYFSAVAHVAVDSFRIAPTNAIVRIVDSIVQAILPILMTYFAARTTTALADAYNGNPQASSQIFSIWP